MSNLTSEPIEVFFSYSHRDESLRDELAKHLSILKHQRVIKEWHDRRISAGSDWKGAIDAHLNSAQIILLLISADFLASDYCYDIELEKALERHDRGEACVIPIILRPVDWHGAPFGRLQALPRDARPITTWTNQDEAFRDIALEIRQTVEKIKQKRQRQREEQVRLQQIGEEEQIKIRLQQQREKQQREKQQKSQQEAQRQGLDSRRGSSGSTLAGNRTSKNRIGSDQFISVLQQTSAVMIAIVVLWFLIGMRSFPSAKDVFLPFLIRGLAGSVVTGLLFFLAYRSIVPARSVDHVFLSACISGFITLFAWVLLEMILPSDASPLVGVFFGVTLVGSIGWYLCWQKNR